MKLSRIAFGLTVFSAAITFTFSVVSLFGPSYFGLSPLNLLDALLITALGWWGFKRENFWPAAVMSLYAVVNAVVQSRYGVWPILYFGVYLLATYDIWRAKGWKFEIQ